MGEGEDILPIEPSKELSVIQKSDHSENKTVQKYNVVSGDLVGRDKIEIHTHNHPKPESTRQELVSRIQKELEQNSEIKKIVSKLEHFNTPVEGEIVIGLEAKLKEGRQDKIYPYAKQAKETFAKKLNSHLFSETAQMILARLLAEIYARFHRHVTPQLNTLSQEQIADLVQEKVLNPLKSEVEAEVLELYADEIDGMLYFLTGNCHIKWA